MHDQLILIYPDLDIEIEKGNIELRNDGEGDYIAKWDILFPEPTKAEIDAKAIEAQAIQLNNSKWNQVDDFKNSLTVTVQSGHKFAANPSALLNIGFKLLNPIPQDAINWVEDWETFTTSTVELQEVLNEEYRLTQEFINLTFGAV